jgi:hypothetical protein
MQMNQEPSAAMFDALRAAKTLLQNPSREVFIRNRSFAQFKQMEAFIGSLPLRPEVPAGFRLWWKASEPERRKSLAKLRKDHRVKRGAYFALTNLPLKELAPDALTAGSFFLVPASKDEGGRIQFSHAMSGFVVQGQMFHEFRHDFSEVVGVEHARAA